MNGYWYNSGERIKTGSVRRIVPIQSLHFSINIYFTCIRILLTNGLCNFFSRLILVYKSTVMFLTALNKDARYFQIMFQRIFLGYGIFYLGWKAEWWLYATYFTAALLRNLFLSIY